MGYRILCFGDSNTYGYDPRSYLGGRYPASVRWTALLKTAGWEINNEGKNGHCIPKRRQEAMTLSQAVQRTGTEIVVVMLGSNDLLQRTPPSAEVCAERMEQFLTVLLEEVLPFYKVLLIAPPPMKLGAWVDNLRMQENPVDWLVVIKLWHKVWVLISRTQEFWT